MSEKYKITAKPGDRRVYKPKLEGKEWTEHPLYVDEVEEDNA